MVHDNFHYMDEDERYEHGVFSTADEAVAACKHIVDQSLKDLCKPGITEQELFEAYTMFGDDPFVVSIDNTATPHGFQHGTIPRNVAVFWRVTAATRVAPTFKQREGGSRAVAPRALALHRKHALPASGTQHILSRGQDYF
jgi:hypothetical protein